MQSLILILAGTVPSIAWLLFFLAKDCHPEPKRRILQTFLLGVCLAPLAITAQYLYVYFFRTYFPQIDVSSSYAFFGWAAIVEELVKLMAVSYVVYRTVDFDEPVDGMIYMITAGLGFAAIENVLVLFRNISDGIGIAFQILLVRTFGATLLHALSSALLGYFVALSWFLFHHSKKILWSGVAIASTFHFLFNMLLLNLAPRNGLMFSSIILFLMVFLITILFHKTQDSSRSKLSTDVAMAESGL